jgi:hypothetical protein
MLRRVAIFCAAVTPVLLLAAAVPRGERPAYARDGSLVAPAQYREWVFLSSGLDMSYTTTQATERHLFSNTFVNPASYRVFLATGKWPDGTTMVLENRAAETPVSINRRGHTQSSTVEPLEFHVKDRGKWSFYRLGGDGKTAKLLPENAGCQQCHAAHGAADETFVQFYPMLLPVAKAKGTLSEAYVKESGETAAR